MVKVVIVGVVIAVVAVHDLRNVGNQVQILGQHLVVVCITGARPETSEIRE